MPAKADDVRVIDSLIEEEYGWIVYELPEEVQMEYYELIPSPRQDDPDYDPENDRFRVYRFIVEPDIIEWHDWVNWKELSRYTGIPLSTLIEMGKSEDPVKRARVLEIIGNYYGFIELDDYPETLTRPEMRERWPEFF